MMFVNHVYSDTKYPFEHYIRGPIQKRAKGLLDPKAIYLYDRLDAATRQVQLEDILTKDVCIQLKTQEDVRLLIYFPDDYLNQNDLDYFKKVIAEKEISYTKIDFIVKDKLFERFVRDSMGSEISIYVYGPLQQRVRYFEPTSETSKKFSVFSRNYNRHRLALFLELEQRDLLKDFYYTFHNFNPYHLLPGSSDLSLEERFKTFSMEDMKADAVGKKLYNKKTQRWMEGIPYKIEDSGSDMRPTLNKWSSAITDAILDSDFHIIVESHFDPFENWKREKDEWRMGRRTIEEFSPAFPTEKTYKLLSCGRPFLAYTTPYFLKELREMGYKTFGRFIDESYDKIEDDDERRIALANEIERISKLPEEEYKYIRGSCFIIAEQNRQKFMQECRTIMDEYKNGPYGEMLVDFTNYWNTLSDDDYITDMDLSVVQE